MTPLWKDIQACATAGELLDLLERFSYQPPALCVRLVRMIARENAYGRLWYSEASILLRRVAKLFNCTLTSLKLDFERARREALTARAEGVDENGVLLEDEQPAVEEPIVIPPLAPEVLDAGIRNIEAEMNRLATQ